MLHTVNECWARTQNIACACWRIQCILRNTTSRNSDLNNLFMNFEHDSCVQFQKFQIQLIYLFYLFLAGKLIDDPYYCGLRARVPNFVKSSKSKAKENGVQSKRISVSNLQHPAASLVSLHQLHQTHPHHQHLYAGSHHSHHPSHHMMLHTRSFESGIGECLVVFTWLTYWPKTAKIIHRNEHLQMFFFFLSLLEIFG